MDLFLCHLTEQLEGISRKKYNLCLLVSLNTPPILLCKLLATHFQEDDGHLCAMLISYS